jgi:hypothetical protein
MNRLSLKERSGTTVLIDLLERWTLLVEAIGEVVETGRRFGDFHAGGNFAPGALKGSGRTLEVGGAPDMEALPARLVALEKLATVMAETKTAPMPRGKKRTWDDFMVLARG